VHSERQTALCEVPAGARRAGVRAAGRARPCSARGLQTGTQAAAPFSQGCAEASGSPVTCAGGGG